MSQARLMDGAALARRIIEETAQSLGADEEPGERRALAWAEGPVVEQCRHGVERLGRGQRGVGVQRLHQVGAHRGRVAGRG
ncbi:hypothetical protein [Streptomyces sp. AK010]|uniref:hypothetical protein n=1 Tax=Streptomyces sp. AK010 TaxID=2723074 RepID=UPI0037DA1ECB